MMDRQNRPHGETPDHNAVATLFETIMLFLDGRIPVGPDRRLEVVAATAMSGELGHMHGVSRVCQALRHIAHFQGRPAQAMDEQETEASSLTDECFDPFKDFRVVPSCKAPVALFLGAPPPGLGR